MEVYQKMNTTLFDAVTDALEKKSRLKTMAMQKTY